MDLLRWGKIIFTAGIFAVSAGCWHAESDTDPFEQALNDDVPTTLRSRNSRADAARRGNSLLAKADAVDGDLHSPLEQQLAILRAEAKQQQQELAKSRSTAAELNRRDAELQTSLRSTEDRIARVEKVMRLLGENPRSLDADSRLEAGSMLSMGGSSKIAAERNNIDIPVDYSPKKYGASPEKKSPKKYPGVGEDQFSDLPMPELRIERGAKSNKQAASEKLLAEISALPSIKDHLPTAAAADSEPSIEATIDAMLNQESWEDVSAIGKGWEPEPTPPIKPAPTAKAASPAWISPNETEVGGFETEKRRKDFARNEPTANKGGLPVAASRVILCDGVGKDATYIISRRAGDEMSEGALYQSDDKNVLVITEVYATNAKAKLHPRFINGEIALDTPLRKINRLPQ